MPKLHEANSGSGESMGVEDLSYYCDWLKLRISEGWEKNKDLKYDNRVRLLAMATIQETTANIAEIIGLDDERYTCPVDECPDCDCSSTVCECYLIEMKNNEVVAAKT